MTKELSTVQFNYIDSLVVTKQSESFDNAIRNFIIDLIEEGFTIDDVKKYIKEKEDRVFFEFRNYNGGEE